MYSKYGRIQNQLGATYQTCMITILENIMLNSKKILMMIGYFALLRVFFRYKY